MTTCINCGHPVPEGRRCPWCARPAITFIWRGGRYVYVEDEPIDVPWQWHAPGVLSVRPP